MKTNVAMAAGKHVAAITHEGAPAAKISHVDALLRSVMSCMLWENDFYEDGISIAERIEQEVRLVSAEEAAAIAYVARTRYNLRHAPLWVVLAMCKAGGEHRKLVGDVLPEVIQRADEIAEFLAMYFRNGKIPVANQVKKGLAKAFLKFNEYELAKYNRDGSVKMRDALFLCHAKPVFGEGEQHGDVYLAKRTKHRGMSIRHIAGHGALWKRLIDGKLATPDTWEVALSAAEGREERASVWRRLIKERNLGAMALLRNLRNMLDDGLSREEIGAALRMGNYDRVLPFRFISAAKVVPELERVIEEAFRASFAKRKILEGRTCVLIDVSGSMEAQLSKKSKVSRMDAACGLAMIAVETFPDCDVMTFSESVRTVAPRRGFALRDAIVNSQMHSSTYLGKALARIAEIGYDRVIVVTDEQSHDRVPKSGIARKMYMVNVASDKNGVGYGGGWRHIDGFSDAAIDWIVVSETEGK